MMKTLSHEEFRNEIISSAPADCIFRYTQATLSDFSTVSSLTLNFRSNYTEREQFEPPDAAFSRCFGARINKRLLISQSAAGRRTQLLAFAESFRTRHGSRTFSLGRRRAFIIRSAIWGRLFYFIYTRARIYIIYTQHRRLSNRRNVHAPEIFACRKLKCRSPLLLFVCCFWCVL